MLEGAIEIVHPYEAGEHRVTVHEVGSFTGELNMLAGRRSLVRARAMRAGRVLEIDRAALRTVVAGRRRAERADHARVHPAPRRA